MAAQRPNPYVKGEPNQIIRAGDWNELQIQAREEIHAHTHTGGEQGPPIGAAGLADKAVTGPKIDPASDVTVNSLNVTGGLTVNGQPVSAAGSALRHRHFHGIVPLIEIIPIPIHLPLTDPANPPNKVTLSLKGVFPATVPPIEAMAIRDGNFMLALTAGGQLFGWGSNDTGQLGTGNFAHQGFPVLVNGDSDWQKVAVGNSHALAIKTNGTLWSWGNNSAGQLGLGNNTNKNSPTQVGTGTGWAQIIGGTDYSLAIKTDGTLWGWGNNSSYCLGFAHMPTTDPATNYGAFQTLPVKIGTDTNWSRAAADNNHVIAVKTDGTLWGWGSNYNGELGPNNLGTPVNTPTQIGVDTRWAAIATGAQYSLAIKTDGTLWGWGQNQEGQLGFPPTIPGMWGMNNVTTPTQVGTDTDWAQVEGGQNHTLALKTDGTLWGWGNNYSFNLGTGTSGIQSTPVKLSQMAGWADLNAGSYTSHILHQDKSLWTAGNGGAVSLNLSFSNRELSRIFTSARESAKTGHLQVLLDGADITPQLLAQTGWTEMGDGWVNHPLYTQGTPPLDLTALAGFTTGNHALSLKVESGLAVFQYDILFS